MSESSWAYLATTLLVFLSNLLTYRRSRANGRKVKELTDNVIKISFDVNGHMTEYIEAVKRESYLKGRADVRHEMANKAQADVLRVAEPREPDKRG